MRHTEGVTHALTIEELELFSSELVDTILERDKPVVIALCGDLGTGKTTLSTLLCKALGVPPSTYISSPTYTLVNEYQGHRKILHFDLYRLSGYDEFLMLGYLDSIRAPQTITLIEWFERIAEEFEPVDFHIQLEHHPQSWELRLLTWHSKNA